MLIEDEALGGSWLRALRLPMRAAGFYTWVLDWPLAAVDLPPSPRRTGDPSYPPTPLVLNIFKPTYDWTGGNIAQSRLNMQSSQYIVWISIVNGPIIAGGVLQLPEARPLSFGPPENKTILECRVARAIDRFSNMSRFGSPHLCSLLWSPLGVKLLRSMFVYDLSCTCPISWYV